MVRYFREEFFSLVGEVIERLVTLFGMVVCPSSHPSLFFRRELQGFDPF